ncbi:MAG TPA: aromatic acid exporter family protein [Tissierellaceae bacterium]|nr:aromatic acid exporter family protein [Tissierellaceae bacterium]
MQFIKKYRIGMRTIKTGLAVAVSLFIAQIFSLENPSFVGIAAIVSMQSTVNESVVAGKNRMLATFVGAIVGLVFSYFLPHNYFFIGIGIILVIYIHNLFGWKQSLTLSAIVFLAIFLNEDTNRMFYALHRLVDTFIGIIVSMLINYFIATPDNIQSLKYIKEHIFSVLKKIIYDIVTKATDIDNNDFRNQLEQYNSSFHDLKKELELNSSNRRPSSKLAFDVLDILEKIEASLLTILDIDISPILNEKNKELFNEIYSEDFTSSDREMDDMDIVYNFHLNKIFNKILEIEELL